MFSQGEAKALGKCVVFTQHLLLGLMDEDRAREGFLGSGITVESARDVVLIENDIDARPFSSQVLACLPPLPWYVSAEDVANPIRLDLRDLRVFGVDPPSIYTDWDGGYYPLTMQSSEDYPSKPPKYISLELSAFQSSMKIVKICTSSSSPCSRTESPTSTCLEEQSKTNTTTNLNMMKSEVNGANLSTPMYVPK